MTEEEVFEGLDIEGLDIRDRGTNRDSDKVESESNFAELSIHDGPIEVKQ